MIYPRKSVVRDNHIRGRVAGLGEVKNLILVCTETLRDRLTQIVSTWPSWPAAAHQLVTRVAYYVSAEENTRDTQSAFSNAASLENDDICVAKCFLKPRDLF